MADKAPPPQFKSFNSTDPIIIEARKRWNRCSEAEDAQRKSILAAKQFRSGDQWDASIKTARQGGAAIAGQPAQPARPCLVVDRLSPPLRQVANIIKNGSFGFDVLPNGHGADEATAEILNGYLRRVINKARDEAPIEWAAENAIEGGLGWFRLRTDYVHKDWTAAPDVAMFDQELCIDRITNNLSVYCDPSATNPTRCDALFKFVTEDLDRDEFKGRYPKADLASLDAFSTTGDPSGWTSTETIRIAEYWRVIFQEKRGYELTDGTCVIGDPPKDATTIRRERVFRVPTVEGYKINAVEVLETMAWAGSHIPLIPIFGEELNVDGKCVLRGMIQEGMDAQRMVNYSYSGGIEDYALATKTTVIAAAGQIDNYKDIWQTRNIYNHAYLPYDPISIAGTIVPPPSSPTSDFGRVQVALGLMAKSEECIAATTSYFDPTDADLSPAQRTGVAIQSMQGQAEGGNSHYPKNTQRAVLYAANLMLEVIPKITRPGQIVHLLGEDDEPSQVIVGKPFMAGSDGTPQPAPGVTPELAKQSGSLAKFYDFNNGTYAVTVTLGKGTATRQQEGSQALGALIPHLPPEMAAVATPDFVEQLQFPGAHQIAEKLRKTLPPALQDQDGANDGIPPQAKAIIQGLQGQVQQLQMAIATKQPEIAAKLQQTQMQENAENQRAQLDRQTQLEKTEIQAAASMSAAQAKVDAENFRSYVDAMEGRIARSLDLHMEKIGHIHEALQASAQHVHDANMERLKQTHALQQIAATPTADPEAAV